jgi:hypothetical protein
LDDFPLSDAQRSEIDTDFLDGSVSHASIVRKLYDWGCPWNEKSVRRHRKRIGYVADVRKSTVDVAPHNEWAKAEIVVGRDGGTLATGTIEAPIEFASDWDGVLRGFGLDPTIFEIVDDTVTMSKWQQSKRLENGDRDTIWLYSYHARFQRKVAEVDEIDLDALRRRVSSWKPKGQSAVATDADPCTFVVCWADWQIAKSAGGGVNATVDRIHESYELCATRIKELRKIGRNIEKVVVINMGDPLEGCDGNYSSQLFSVELTQREQLNLVLDLWTNGIFALEPDVFASVLCNHGEWTRRGPGTRPVTTDSDNVGGYLGDTLQRVFENREGAPTEWAVAHDEMVQMLDLSGLDVAITHGHKITSHAKELEWLRGQSIRLLREHGREPRLWVTAHRHHVRVDDFGPWWRLQCPSLDGGSKWYADSSGQWSTPGTMTFLAGLHDPRGWSDMAILGTHTENL